MRRRAKTFFLLLVSVAVQEAAADPLPAGLGDIVGLRGGLIVHVGCRDGVDTVALSTGGRCIVQGLSANPESVAEARARVKSAGACGRVSIHGFSGAHLPYVDSLVNVLVLSDAGRLSVKEIERVLVPGGAALLPDGQTVTGLTTAPVMALKGWRIFKKAWPDDIAEWTHYLYDPQGTCVSPDRRVGNPRGLRWTGGPLWARSHEHTASMQCMVSAGGRVFYVMDEGPTESIQLPADFRLTARDAFNGVVLWTRPVPHWFNALYPLKSGPGWMPRRLVAVGDRVYVAPGVGQEILCLDAATGDALQTYAGTASTFELVVSDDVVFAAVDPDGVPCDYNQQQANCWKERDRANRLWGWTQEDGTRVIKAIRASDGALLWDQESPVAPMTLAVDRKRVCFFDGTAVVALDRRTGHRLWKTDTVAVKQIRTGYAGPRLVLGKDRILFSPTGHVVALDLETGTVQWSVNKKPRSGHFSLEDFYVIGGKVWALQRRNSGALSVYRLQDGTPLENRSNPIPSFYIHQRCYPGRATERVQLLPMMGILVYEMDTDRWTCNHWIRGGCTYGIMPANGMIYTTPNACACYYQSRLNGFNAVAAEAQPSKAPSVEQRLVRGPAYGNTRDTGRADSGEEWPTYRHDRNRSGCSATSVPAGLRPAWRRTFGTKVSQPVVADGRLYFSAVDAHTVYALDAASGKDLWHFIAGGRIDSPPTLYRGLAIFGCADGWIYAVRAVDGQLAWKFHAAPNERMLVSYGQVESVWPLSGSVLIQNGTLYCVAGRSMFLDGGLRMLVIAPETGELITENVMDRQVPGSEKTLDELLMGKHMPVAQPDILSGDGTYVYMKSQTFTSDGRRLRVRPQRPDTQYDREIHLFSPTSFLDSSWHQRTYWIYGRAAGEGWAEFQLPPKRVPCGRILCIDGRNAYGYGRDPELMCNTSVSEYRLYSTPKFPARKVGIARLEGSRWTKGEYADDKSLAGHTVDWKQLALQPRAKLSALEYNWIHEDPAVIAKAMVVAGERLFVAGPRDVVDEKQMWGRSNEEIFKKKMASQAEWLAGTRGACLQVFAKKDGTKLAELALDVLPAFDGLIAAAGRLYMASADGSIVCLEGR